MALRRGERREGKENKRSKDVLRMSRERCLNVQTQGGEEEKKKGSARRADIGDTPRLCRPTDGKKKRGKEKGGEE